MPIINSNNTIVNALSSNSLNTTNKTLVGAINENKNDIDTIENTLPNLASQSYVDQKFNGAAKAISFDSYATMITAFNALTDDVYVSGQNINILTLEVPDLWVYEVDSTRIPYTYVDDATFTNELSTNGYVQVGFYKLAALETQKVDLTDYQEKLTTTNVPSGTITESIGFNANNELVRGAGGSYTHNIQLTGTGGYSVLLQIVNNNSNLFTIESLRQYLYNNGFTSSSKIYMANSNITYGYDGNSGLKNIYGICARASGVTFNIYSSTVSLSIDFDNKTFSFQKTSISDYASFTVSTITDTVT